MIGSFFHRIHNNIIFTKVTEMIVIVSAIYMLLGIYMLSSIDLDKLDNLDQLHI